MHLIRTYHPLGTNGEFKIKNEHICCSIELPWMKNAQQVSCIPEGTYPLIKRYSKKFGWHILVENVEDRSLILIHPANDAKKELRGCIAPVSQLVSPGVGLGSKKAFQRLVKIIYELLDEGETVSLKIQNVKLCMY